MRWGKGVFGSGCKFLESLTVLTIFGSLVSMSSFAMISCSFLMNMNHFPCCVFIVGYIARMLGSASKVSTMVLLYLSVILEASSVRPYIGITMVSWRKLFWLIKTCL